MTKTLWRSAFVAALFALHPLHVESVAWVAERKDVLSTFFWMLTMLAYARYAERPEWKRYLTVCGCFALGLLAKPMLVTLPFVLLLLDYWPLHRLERPERSAPRKSPAEGRRKKKGRRVAAIAPVQPVFSQWAMVRPLLLEKVPLLFMAALS